MLQTKSLTANTLNVQNVKNNITKNVVLFGQSVEKISLTDIKNLVKVA